MVPTELSLETHGEIRPRVGFAYSVEPAIRVILLGALLSAPIIVLGMTNVGGLRTFWDNLQWILSSAAAFGATLIGAQSATGRAGTIRRATAVALGLWMLANITWALLALFGVASIPSVADIFVVALFVPAVFVLVKAVEGRLSVAEEVAVYFDSILVVILIGTTLILVHGPTALALPSISGISALAYPTAFIGLAAAGMVAFLAIRQPVVPRGAFAMMLGTALIGLGCLGFIGPAATGTVGGALPGILFTVGTLVAGLGGATWRDETVDSPRYAAATRYASRVIGPIAAAVTFVGLLVTVPAPIEGVVRIAAFATGTLFVIRQGLLLRERTNMLAEVRALQKENDRLVDELRAELLERERVQDQLMNTSRLAAIGELAAGVAHEVNNPLTSVLGFAEILIDDLHPDDPHRQDIQTIRDEALRARAIVRALRDFARPGKPVLAPTDLAGLITRTTDLVRFPLAQAGVIIAESHAELPLIALDPQAIQQAILNVLTNAMQAMPDGGSLRIESSIQGSAAVVTISDSGVGMDEIVAAQAFVPFFSARRDDGSPGLGLSVSLGLVKSHRGTIWLQSEPGAGTTVVISLPIVAADRAHRDDKHAIPSA